MKARVREDMPEGFFAFYNNRDGSAVRRYPGDEFDLVDTMSGPDNKRVVAVKAEDTFSSRWMEVYDGEKWVDEIPKKKSSKPVL